MNLRVTPLSSVLTCGDVMVYTLYRHSGVGNGVPLLILHNASDATMYLDSKELYSLDHLKLSQGGH